MRGKASWRLFYCHAERGNITLPQAEYHLPERQISPQGSGKVMSFSDIFCCAESDICWSKRNCGCTAVILPALRAVPNTATRSEAISLSLQSSISLCRRQNIPCLKGKYHHKGAVGQEPFAQIIEFCALGWL